MQGYSFSESSFYYRIYAFAFEIEKAKFDDTAQAIVVGLCGKCFTESGLHTRLVEALVLDKSGHS